MSSEFLEKLKSEFGLPKTLEANIHLFHQGDRVNTVFVVLEGTIDLVRTMIDGRSITVQRASANSILAEASIYSQIYHCDALTRETSTVIQVPKTDFLRVIENDPNLALLWSKHLAHEIQTTRGRLEIMSRYTVADRLDGWMALNNTNLPPKGEWKSIAEQIGVSPEALYREIAKRTKAAH